MRKFVHVNALSLDAAVSILNRYGNKAKIIAGGTDLLGSMKDEILPRYPEAVVNIKRIPDLDFIREEEGILKIGALARLADIAENGLIKEKYPALAQAAQRCATPHIREMGTIGGNICQDIRCWYYRNPDNRFPCLRKGGGRCYAINGDNRYHSIFGGSVEDGCYAVHPSDTAPSLIALDAGIKTTKRTLKAEDFFMVDVMRTTVLDDYEVVTQIEIPRPIGKSSFQKFALRRSIDFPIVNCAASVRLLDNKVEETRVCLNAIFVTPYRALKAEQFITGKTLNESNAEAAGEATVSDARPMTHNKYMLPIARALVKRTLLACA